MSLGRPLAVRTLRLIAPLLLIAACGRADGPPADASAGAETASAGGAAGGAPELRALAAPASWEGNLPCADCAGITARLTLHPDGRFESESAYRGTGGLGDTVFADFGRWFVADDRSRIELRGSADVPTSYGVEPDGRLQLRDVAGNPITSTLDYSLRPLPAPLVLAHPARLVGAIAHLADAPAFVECGSGLPLPVAMIAAWPEVEQAYRAAGVRAGAPLPMRLRAHVEARAVVDGDTLVPTVVIDSLVRAEPAATCAALALQDTVAAHAWRLAALPGAQGVGAIPADSRAGFVWDRAEGRFSGSTGCNRYSAAGLLRGASLVAREAIGTKMACADDAARAVEQRLYTLLAAPTVLRLVNDTLVWSRGPATVARFVRDTADGASPI